MDEHFLCKGSRDISVDTVTRLHVGRGFAFPLAARQKTPTDSGHHLTSYSVGTWGFLAGLSQSVQRLTTCWTFRGSNPGGREIFRTRPDRPRNASSLLYYGFRVFHGVKRPERGVDHTSRLAPRLKKR